jgi:hypothetical protein
MMGYRSEVAYGIRLSRSHEDDGQLMEQLKANDMNLDDIWGMFIADVKVNCGLAVSEKLIVADHKQRWLKFHMTDLKWYADFEDVQSHEKIIDIACEYNKRYVDDYNLPELFDVSFVRIGEDPEDIDHRISGEGYDMFHPVTILDGAFYHHKNVEGEEL